MLGSPFDLSKEIAAIAARRAPGSEPRDRHDLAKPTTDHADAAGHGASARHHGRLPTAINLNELV